MHFTPLPLLLTAVLSLWAIAASAQSVALTGVSGSKALVVIDGAAPRFLSAGQSHQGVKLLSLQGLDADGIERRVRERFSHLVGTASAASATT